MAPKTKAQFEEIRQRSKSTIKEVALELFARYGYQSTSISKIAKEAGISKGLIYNYFNSKEELLNTIILEAVETGVQMMDQLIKQYPDPKECLRQIVHASLQMIRSNLHYWKLMMSLAFQTDILKGVEPILKRKEQITLSQAAQIFEQLGYPEPKKEAYYFGAVMDGIVLHYMNFGEHYPLDDMINYLFQHYGLNEAK